MNIDENTKVMARFHKEPNNRGLSIYNPYFEEVKENAIYVLFHNSDPTPLIDGLRKLNLSGAIPAGFEKDPKLAQLVDELGPIAKKIRRIGVIANENGKIVGYHQAGYGLAESILRMTKISDKKLVIFGAGNVAKALLIYFSLEDIKPSSIEIYNRTIEKAELLAKEFSQLSKVGSIQDMEKSSGDIFVNCTDVGSPWLKGKNYKFKEKMMSNFDYIADVTFVPLKPQLIELADKLGKAASPGWKMFLYQGKLCLEKVLGIEVNEEILAKHIIKDFKQNWS